MPKVSITVAAYNVHEWIEDCLDSIIAQTFTDFECIVVDDGSCDITPDIVEAYARKDSRIKLVRHEQNKGIGFTRIEMFNLAQGKYIWQIDGDDFIPYNALEILCGIAERDGCDIVRGQFSTIQNNNLDSIKSGWLQNANVCNAKFESLVPFLTFPGGIWLNFFKRSFIENLDISAAKNLGVGEDAIINSIFYTASKLISLTSKNIYYYRVRKGSTMQRSPKEFPYLDEARAHKIIFENYDGFPLAQMLYTIFPSYYRFQNIQQACLHSYEPEAVKVINNYSPIYKQYDLLISFKLAKHIKPIPWDDKKEAVMSFMEQIRFYDPSYLYQKINYQARLTKA